ncbi:hypothetical protein GCM10009760_19770 [Kitasatospora kazusensis]|uniref:Uncharacterized protein n=1 Tax=Kitasatospora kazusensis TaxID=407974 RepID=A0ABP5KZU3_9ACTN
MPAPAPNDPHRRHSRAATTDRTRTDPGQPTAAARIVLDLHRNVAGECVRGCGPWPCDAVVETTTGAGQ